MPTLLSLLKLVDEYFGILFSFFVTYFNPEISWEQLHKNRSVPPGIPVNIPYLDGSTGFADHLFQNIAFCGFCVGFESR